MEIRNEFHSFWYSCGIFELVRGTSSSIDALNFSSNQFLAAFRFFQLNKFVLFSSQITKIAISAILSTEFD